MWPGKPALAGTRPSPESILGTTLAEYWHASRGVTLNVTKVMSWTGQVLGAQFVQPTDSLRPTYGADGTAFGGRSVINIAIGANQVLYTSGAPTLFAAGTKPYVAAWMRSTSLPAWANIAQFCDVAVSQNAPGLYRDSTTIQAWCSTGGPATASNTSLAPMFVEAYYDASNSAVAIDGGTPVLGSVGTLAAAVNYVQCKFGILALLVACKSVPSAAQRAALRAYANQQFPP